MSQADNIVISEDANEIVTVRTKPCWICGQYSYLQIPWIVWSAYEGLDMHIDTAWPHGSPEDRQILRTGIHPKCWDEKFPEQLESEK